MPGSMPPLGSLTTFTRTFNLGPRDKDLVLQVARVPGAKVERSRQSHRPRSSSSVSPVAPRSASGPDQFVFDGATRVEVAQPEDFDLAGADYTISARIKTKKGGTLFARAPATKKWARGGKALFVRKGKLVFDIGWVGEVSSRSRVDDDRWHDVALTYEHRTRPGTPLHRRPP